MREKHFYKTPLIVFALFRDGLLMLNLLNHLSGLSCLLYFILGAKIKGELVFAFGDFFAGIKTVLIYLLQAKIHFWKHIFETLHVSINLLFFANIFLAGNFLPI